MLFLFFIYISFNIIILLYLLKLKNKLYSYTSLDPRATNKFYLPELVIGGKYNFKVFSDTEAKSNLFFNQWGIVMYDALITPEWTKVGRDKGYADHKYVIYGGKEAGPLSFHMNINNNVELNGGYVSI